MLAYGSEGLCYHDVQIAGEMQVKEQAIFADLNSIIQHCGQRT